MESRRVGLKTISSNRQNVDRSAHKIDDLVKPVDALLKNAISSPAIDAKSKQSPDSVAVNKENGEQTALSKPIYKDSAAQTVVSIEYNAPISYHGQDLFVEEPTAAYYRALTEKFDRELEAQIDIRMSLCHEMADAEAELRAEEEELQTLKEVLEEMNYEDETGEKEDESK